MGRLQQLARPLSAGARDHSRRAAAQPLGGCADIRQSGRLLELVGLQRRSPVSDEEGRSGPRDLEDGPAARGEVGREGRGPGGAQRSLSRPTGAFASRAGPEESIYGLCGPTENMAAE